MGILNKENGAACTGRRAFLSGIGTSLLTLAACGRETELEARNRAIQEAAATGHRRNISSFQTGRWEDHFTSLEQHSAILADTRSRALFFWPKGGGEMLTFPTSVPREEDLLRTGYTHIVRKAVAPRWTPTPSMRERDPTLPAFIPGGVPENPLGTHAMYLTWPAYLIHGTHDTRKIGRRSSDGCIGLYNEHIDQLFQLCEVGTQVKII